MRSRKILGLALIAAMGVATTGCLELIFRQTVPLSIQLIIFGVVPIAEKGEIDAAKRGPKRVKFKNKDDVELSGSIGGLSGTYDVDVGEYGTIEGTADIKGSFRAKVKSNELDEEAASVIEAAILDRFDVEVDVTSTKIRYSGRQTTGGVKKIFNTKISYKGTVVSGEHAGRKIKGTMKVRGKFTD